MISVEIQTFERKLILMMEMLRENRWLHGADELDRFYGGI